MATIATIKEILASIKGMYDYFGRGSDFALKTALWELSLNEYSDDIVKRAFVMCLKTCPNPPTPADIISHIKEIERASKPTDEKLWVLLTEALRETNVQVYKLRYPEYGVDHRAKITEIWEALPEEIKQYLGGEGELMQMSKCSPEELKYEKTRFFKRLPSIREGIENDLLPSLTDGKTERGMLCDSSATHS